MQEHLFELFTSESHSGCLGNVSITLIDKTDGKDPKRRENYWMRTPKTYAPMLHASIPCRSINVTGGLSCLVFFWHIG